MSIFSRQAHTRAEGALPFRPVSSYQRLPPSAFSPSAFRLPPFAFRFSAAPSAFRFSLFRRAFRLPLFPLRLPSPPRFFFLLSPNFFFSAASASLPYHYSCLPCICTLDRKLEPRTCFIHPIVILSFADGPTEALWLGHRPPELPPSIHKVGLRKLTQLEAASLLDELRLPPGNRLEALKGDRAGQHSIRVNDQYRVCFRWEGQNARDVTITDYH